MKSILDLKYYNTIDYNIYIKTPLIERCVLLEDKGIYEKLKKREKDDDYALNKHIFFNLNFELFGHNNEYVYKIKDDIILEYYDFLEQEIKIDVDHALNDLEFKLGLFNSTEEKLNFLYKKKKKNIKCINSKWSFQFYFGKKNNFYKNWMDYIIKHKDFKQTLFKIICGFIALPKANKMMIEWSKIAVTKSELKFCENELKNFEKGKKNSENFNSRVFKSPKAQEIFHKILLNENVLDEDNNAGYKFQSVAYNTFQTPITYKNILFKTEFLYVFAEFLITEYKAKIKDKSKFANQNNNLIDRIVKIIKNELKVDDSLNPNKAEL